MRYLLDTDSLTFGLRGEGHEGPRFIRGELGMTTERAVQRTGAVRVGP